MSHDASITIHLLAAQHDISFLLTTLLDAGWRPWDPEYEHIGYYTLGQSCGFAYTYVPRSTWSDVLDGIRATSSQLETMMIKLYLEPTMVELQVAPDRKTILISIENYSRRKLTELTVLTDFTWYLGHVVLPLERAGMDIVSVECTDVPYRTACGRMNRPCAIAVGSVREAAVVDSTALRRK